MARCSVTLESPVGLLRLGGDGERLSRLEFVDADPAAGRSGDPGLFREAREQLGEYFAGERRRFTLALDLHGTPFQLAVWAALQEIRYGETVSYAELARRLGRPGAFRAVGLANGQNPVAVVVPCHRVIGSDGGLTGYGGGLGRKRALLDLEAGRIPLAEAG